MSKNPVKPNHWTNSIVGYADEDPESLLANPQNYRLHPKEQTDALKGSLNKLGWIAPVIVNITTQHVVDGHARIGEAIARGEPTVPVAYVKLTEEQERIALASFDPITSLAGIDQEILNELIASVNVDDAGLQALLDSLSSVVEPTSKTSLGEDQLPEITDDTIVSVGELWALGNHFLLCGDSTDPKALNKLFGNDQATLCVTSPPYWVGRDYEIEHGEAEIRKHIAGASEAISSVMKEKSIIIINTGTTAETRQGGEVRRVWLLLDWWRDELRKHKWNMRNVRIWAKEGGFSSFSPDQDLTGQDWEFLGQFTRDKGMRQNRLSDAPRWALDGVWDCQPQTASVGHSAPFPVEIPRRYMLLYTQPGDIIFEPYSGSGTTIIAGEQLDRRVFAVDVDPKSVQLGIERWQQLTGKEAVREDGTSWSALVAKKTKVLAA